MLAEERRGEERNGRPLGNQVNLGKLFSVGHRRPVTAMCHKRKTGRQTGRGEYLKVFTGQSKQIDSQFGRYLTLVFL